MIYPLKNESCSIAAMLVDQRVEALLNSTTPALHLGWKLIDQPWYWIGIQTMRYTSSMGIHLPPTWLKKLILVLSWLPNFETNLLILEEWHDHPGTSNGSQKSPTHTNANYPNIVRNENEPVPRVFSPVCPGKLIKHGSLLWHWVSHISTWVSSSVARGGGTPKKIK